MIFIYLFVHHMSRKFELQSSLDLWHHFLILQHLVRKGYFMPKKGQNGYFFQFSAQTQ